MRFSFEISSPQLKVFSAVCSNFVVVWLVAIFTTRDTFVIIRYVMVAVLAWYAAVWAEEVLENP